MPSPRAPAANSSPALLSAVVASLFGCAAERAFPPLPESLPVPALSVGPVKAGAVAAIREAPAPSPGAALWELAETNVATPGTARVQVRARAEGRWSGGAAGLAFEAKTIQTRPDDPKLTDAVRARLEKGLTPAELPLGPLALLDGPPSKEARELPMATNHPDAAVTLEGRWRCTRTDGEAAGASARGVSCSVVEGRARQAAGRARHGAPPIDARLVGALHAVRTAGGDGKATLEEVHLVMAVSADVPSPVRMDILYRRRWCAAADACPKVDW